MPSSESRSEDAPLFEHLVICQRIAREFPAYRLTVETDGRLRPSYTATARQLSTHPYACTTTDPAELRAALTP